jgi:hypothetical protein
MEFTVIGETDIPAERPVGSERNISRPPMQRMTMI